MELLRSGLPSYYYICKLQTEYDMENRLTVGFTHGDVNGIGYELIIKMMAENRICEVCTPVLFGSSKVAAYHRKALNIENFSLNSIQNARDANPKRCNIVNCVDDAIKVDLGQETPESDDAAVLALKAALTALDLLLSRISRSEKISSRLIVSISRAGSIFPSTWITLESSKQRTT